MEEAYTVQPTDTGSALQAEAQLTDSRLSMPASGSPSVVLPGEELSIDNGSAQYNIGLVDLPEITPTDPSRVDEYLGLVQRASFVQESEADSPLEADAFVNAKSAVSQEIDNFQQNLTGDLKAPEAPNLVDTFERYREEFGLGGLEKEIANLRAQEQNINASLRQRRSFEEGKAVSLDVISGRVGEVERQERENLDFVQRQINYRSDQLNSAYGVINQMIQLTQMDFQNAQATYETQFNQKMQMYQQLRSEEVEDRDFNFKMEQAQKDQATANLQIYMDMIKSGNMKYKNLPAETKSAITKMEIQSGLGEGFLSKLKMDPGANIKSITQRTAPDGKMYADIIKVGSNGKVKVQTKYLGKDFNAVQRMREAYMSSSRSSSSSSKSTASERKAAKEGKAALTMTKAMKTVQGKDGYISPGDYQKLRRGWTADGYNAADFDARFNTYINPSHWWDYAPEGALRNYFE